MLFKDCFPKTMEVRLYYGMLKKKKEKNKPKNSDLATIHRQSVPICLRNILYVLLHGIPTVRRMKLL